MSTIEELNESSGEYLVAARAVRGDHDALRLTRDKLVKRRDKINKKIDALDAHAVHLMELEGMYIQLGIASEAETFEEVADELSFNGRYLDGDSELEYTCVDRTPRPGSELDAGF